MSRRTFIRSVAWTLLVTVLFMFGATTGGAVAHEIQHAHHTAATHGTGICAWMCASANTVATAIVVPSAVAPVEALPVPVDLHAASAESSYRLQARGPPSPLL